MIDPSFPVVTNDLILWKKETINLSVRIPLLEKTFLNRRVLLPRFACRDGDFARSDPSPDSHNPPSSSNDQQNNMQVKSHCKVKASPKMPFLNVASNQETQLKLLPTILGHALPCFCPSVPRKRQRISWNGYANSTGPNPQPVEWFADPVAHGF